MIVGSMTAKDAAANTLLVLPKTELIQFVNARQAMRLSIMVTNVYLQPLLVVLLASLPVLTERE